LICSIIFQNGMSTVSPVEGVLKDILRLFQLLYRFPPIKRVGQLFENQRLLFLRLYFFHTHTPKM